MSRVSLLLSIIAWNGARDVSTLRQFRALERRSRGCSNWEPRPKKAPPERRNILTPAALDAAVLAAYGFSSNKDLLVQILELILSVVQRLEQAEPVTTHGILANFSNAETLVSGVCISAPAMSASPRLGQKWREILFCERGLDTWTAQLPLNARGAWNKPISQSHPKPP